ncbi:MAG TPA: hypothetical protein DEB09_01395 [Candidatus Magasanikbacteria bacterium]|nr:hypothetical protein [Candidatus Magasanikbacteria bacterium]
MYFEKNLQQLGLTEKEAKVYLANLELGIDSVQNIAKKAGVKRATTYVIIEELKMKGLIFEKPTSKGKLYIAENPEKLKNILKEREKILSETIPFLRAIYNSEKGKPQIQVYEGLEAMKHVYLDTIWKSKTEILFFSSIKKIYEKMPELLEEWLKGIKDSKITNQITREFINPDVEDIKYGKRLVKISRTQQVRVLPKNFPLRFVGSDCVIFEDKFMIISYEQKLFTTVIQSQTIADSMRALYEFAWQFATPIEKFH